MMGVLTYLCGVKVGCGKLGVEGGAKPERVEHTDHFYTFPLNVGFFPFFLFGSRDIGQVSSS
jgi:hypothetical protein